MPERKRYIMKKTTKGAIAVGAATLLLLGGGGTFALWNSDATVSAGTIESGSLALNAAAGDGTWYEEAALTNAITWGNEGAGYAIVPGDTVYWESTDLTVTGEGDNLSFAFIAELKSTLATTFDFLEVEIVSATQTGTAANLVAGPLVTLANQTTFSPATLPVDTQIWTVSNGNVVTATFNVVIKVTFDEDLTGSQQQLQSFSLDDAVLLTLQQVLLP